MNFRKLGNPKPFRFGKRKRQKRYKEYGPKHIKKKRKISAAFIRTKMQAQGMEFY